MLKDQVPAVKLVQGSRPQGLGTNILIGGGFILKVASMDCIQSAKQVTPANKMSQNFRLTYFSFADRLLTAELFITAVLEKVQLVSLIPFQCF